MCTWWRILTLDMPVYTFKLCEFHMYVIQPPFVIAIVIVVLSCTDACMLNVGILTSQVGCIFCIYTLLYEWFCACIHVLSGTLSGVRTRTLLCRCMHNGTSLPLLPCSQCMFIWSTEVMGEDLTHLLYVYTSQINRRSNKLVLCVSYPKTVTPFSAIFQQSLRR